MEFKTKQSKKHNNPASEKFFGGHDNAFFPPSIIQGKLKVNEPGDQYEQEADNMAEKVMKADNHPKHAAEMLNNMPKISPIQRQEINDETSVMENEEQAPQAENEAAEENINKSADADKEEESTQETLSLKRSNSSTSVNDIPADFSSLLTDAKSGGSAMPPHLKGDMEAAFGTDFSAVRLHTDEKSAQLNDEVQAKAFTNGQDIYFNTGQYQPQSKEGKALLAHELTHVVQQGNCQPPAVQRSLWSSIKKAAGAVWGGVKKIGSAIGSGFKKAGKWIAGGAKWLWGKLKWFGSQLIDKIAGIFQRFAYWLSQLPSRVGRLLSTLWKGLKTFKPWTLSWWKSLAKLDTWKDFLKWIGTSFLDILEVIGFGEAYETIMDFIKFNTRVLSAAEVKAGKSIFGHTINFDFVRVDEGAIIGPAFTKRAYTSFHTINTWGKETMDVIIHELTHVWQYENAGAIYMPQAIHAQAWGAGYNYGDVAGLQSRQAAGKGLLSFNREQQAQIVQDFFQLRQTGSVAGGTATSADLPLYADFVKTVSSLSVTDLMKPV